MIKNEIYILFLITINLLNFTYDYICFGKLNIYKIIIEKSFGFYIQEYSIELF